MMKTLTLHSRWIIYLHVFLIILLFLYCLFLKFVVIEFLCPPSSTTTPWQYTLYGTPLEIINNLIFILFLIKIPFIFSIIILFINKGLDQGIIMYAMILAIFIFYLLLKFNILHLLLKSFLCGYDLDALPLHGSSIKIFF